MLPLRRAWIQQRLRGCPKRELSLAYKLHEPEEPEPGHASLIVLHGLFGSKQNNRSISKALARDLKAPVYALDLRNHGESPHDPVHDYPSMASDVEHFIRQHDLRLPILIGHSMGAKVAMTVALRSPRLLGALIPVDNAPIDANLKSDFHKYVRGMRDIEKAQVEKQAEADDILKKYEEAQPIRQFLLTNLVRSSFGDHLRLRIPLKTIALSLDKMGDFPFKDPDEAHYDGQTLIVRGTKSRYVADDVLPLVGRFFPTFKLIDIDSGHWVISEKPEAFRRAVVDFLRESEEREI
ncbi:Alpha/Beta hydrolase protein [Usnea florida]